MLQTSNYRPASILCLLTLILSAVGKPQDDGSYGSDMQTQGPIRWNEYNGYFNLRPCLKGMFDKGDIANNVDCSTNSCLCDKKNVKSNIAMLLTQVPATCTDIRAVDIPMATSVLTGYCGEMKGGSSPNTATITTAPQNPPAEPTEDQLSTPGAPEPTSSVKDAPQPTTLRTEMRTSTHPAKDSTTETTGHETRANVDSTLKIALPSTIAPAGIPVPTSPAPNPASSKSPPTPKSAPKDEGSDKGGLIAGIVAGAIVAVIASFIFWMCCYGPCSNRKRGDQNRHEAAARIVGISKGPTKVTGRRPWEDPSPEMGFSVGFDTVKPAELEASSTPTPTGPHELDSTPQSSKQVKLLPHPQRTDLLDEKRPVAGAAVLRSPRF